MDYIELMMNLFDYATSTSRKRHVTGGLLMSVSMLFGGLAFTVMTIKKEEDEKYV